MPYFWGRRGFVHTARHVRPLGRMWLSAATQTIRSCCSDAVAAPIKERLTDARAAPSSSGTGDDPYCGIPPWKKKKKKSAPHPWRHRQLWTGPQR